MLPSELSFSSSGRLNRPGRELIGAGPKCSKSGVLVVGTISRILNLSSGDSLVVVGFVDGHEPIMAMIWVRTTGDMTST
jgi:hypothetical protein